MARWFRGLIRKRPARSRRRGTADSWRAPGCFYGRDALGGPCRGCARRLGRFGARSVTPRGRPARGWEFRDGALVSRSHPETTRALATARHGGFLACTGVFLRPRCARGTMSRLRATFGPVWRPFGDASRPACPRLGVSGWRVGFAVSSGNDPRARDGAARRIPGVHRGVFTAAMRSGDHVEAARDVWAGLAAVRGHGVAARPADGRSMMALFSGRVIGKRRRQRTRPFPDARDDCRPSGRQ
jgi:hypothetical protein